MRVIFLSPRLKKPTSQFCIHEAEQAADQQEQRDCAGNDQHNLADDRQDAGDDFLHREFVAQTFAWCGSNVQHLAFLSPAEHHPILALA
jgi:hypothetical protein